MAGPITDREFVERLFEEHYRDHADLERRIQMLLAAAQERKENMQREMDKRDAQDVILAEAHATAHAREHAMTEAALTKAEVAVDKRLEQMNEFRGALSDLSMRMATREMLETNLGALHDKVSAVQSNLSQRLDTAHEGLDKRIRILETANANLSGRLTAMGIGIGLVVIVVNIGLRFL